MAIEDSMTLQNLLFCGYIPGRAKHLASFRFPLALSVLLVLCAQAHMDKGVSVL